MSTDDPLKNWQLDDRKEDAEQWKLEDAEQDLNKHLQLQPGEAGPHWQPIEYERNAAPQRRNWVLPSVLLVALLAVLGYVGWIAFGQMSDGGTTGFGIPIPGLAAEPTATFTPEAAVAVAPETATPVPPTPTIAPQPTATATVEPSPTIAMAQLISGTVNAVGGVNARKEPAITGEVLTLLDQGAGMTVVRQQDQWLQVILGDGVTVAWVAAEFVDQTPQAITLAELATIYAAAGLPVPSAEAAPLTSLLPAPSVTATTLITDSLADIFATTPTAAPGADDAVPPLVTSGVVPNEPFTNTLPVAGPALTITDTTGVNARSAPSTDGGLIVTVPNGAVLPVTGRTVAGDWLQVQLPDGVTAWMFAEAVVASPDAASAPVVEAAAAAVQTTTAPANTLVEGAPSGATATITNELGANLRSAPSRDLGVVYSALQNESFTVVGRNGDGEWVQLVLPDGTFAWALATTVQLSIDAATLPVTQP